MEKAQSLDERGLKGQRSVMKWQSMKVVNLVHQCKERGLTSTGSRAVLIQRLHDHESNCNYSQKTALLKSSDIESNTDDDYEIEEVSVDGHDIANDSGCPTSDNEDILYRLQKSSPIKPSKSNVSDTIKPPVSTLDEDYLSQKRTTVSSDTSTTRSQLRAALSIDNHLACDDGPDGRSVGCTGCEAVSHSVSSLKREMAKLWRRHSADNQVRPVMASLLPVNSGGLHTLRNENDRLKAQNIKLMREVATLRRELDETSGDKESLVRIVCLLAKDKTSTISSQEFEIIDNK